MGMPAARIGDMTAHGSPLAPGIGSMNVLIGNRPAWRALADFHACPIVKVLVPDVGGVVIKGSMTVLINNLPAARLGDMIVEATSVNSIVLGEFTVLIGG
jgi:uncharacterized Zn-binding protein involved in type VI secretion